MATNVPVTDWRRTSGNGELGSTSATLVTDSDEQIVTLSGLSLIALPGSYTPVPASDWATVETVPASTWRTTTGLNESTSDGPFDISDPQGDLLVDTLGNQVVDTGVTMDIIPASDWEEDDSI